MACLLVLWGSSVYDQKKALPSGSVADCRVSICSQGCSVVVTSEGGIMRMKEVDDSSQLIPNMSRTIPV